VTGDISASLDDWYEAAGNHDYPNGGSMTDMSEYRRLADALEARVRAYWMPLPHAPDTGKEGS
jgi:hypothetical protein